VLEALGSTQYYITINNKRVTDKKLRQAINYAVDKEGILRTVLLGAGKLANAVYMNPTVDGYSPGTNYPYNPDRAKQLLDEAGWRMGSDGIREQGGKKLQLELVTRKGGTAGDYEICELVQGMLKQVGIDVKLTVEESATFLQRVTRPYQEATYDMVMLTFGTFQGDAEYTIRTAYVEDAFAPRYYNRAYYTNPQVEKLVQDSLQAPNRAERDKIYAEIIKIVTDDAPILMLFDSITYLAINEKVNGVYIEPAGSNWPAKYAWKAR